jgi:DNA polymerase III subunit gamma/tau
LFGYFRDCMAAAVGCSSESFLYTAPSGASRVAADGQQLGLYTVLAAMQILDQALFRLRYSTQARIIAELAMVRISHLEDLDEIPELIARLRSGVPAVSGGNPRAAAVAGAAINGVASPARVEPAGTPSARDRPAAAAPAGAPTAGNVATIWSAALARLSGMIVDQAKHCEPPALVAPDRLLVRFKAEYAIFKSACERPEQVAKFEQALAEVTGTSMRVEFALCEEDATQPQPGAPAKAVSQHARLLEVMKHPMVQKANELFGAQPVRIDDPSPGE